MEQNLTQQPISSILMQPIGNVVTAPPQIPMQAPQLPDIAPPAQQQQQQQQQQQPSQNTMMAKPVVFDLTREDLVIRIFFSDPNIANKMNPMLEPALYNDGNNKSIIKTISQFVRKYKRHPSAQELVTGMERTGYSEGVRCKLINICNTPTSFMHYDYIVSMLEGFYHERKSMQLLLSQGEALHEGRPEDVMAMLPALKDALNFSLHLNLGINVQKDVAEAHRRLKAAQECIPSAINEIRFYTSAAQHSTNSSDYAVAIGGYYRKTLSLFIGQPNVGKSLILCSETAFAASHGYNVLYITLELAEEYVWRRIAANLTDTSQFDVLNYSVEECQQIILNSKVPEAAVMGEIQVKELPTTATPAEIEALVDAFEVSLGRKVDLLVIDYIGIMKPNRSARVSESSMYSDGVAKAEQIRDLCKKRSIAGLSAVQFNRTGYKKLDAGMESVEGSSGYSETADFMATITCDSVLAENGMLSNTIVKNRMGKKDISFLTKVDYVKMKFYTPSLEDQQAYNNARGNQTVTDFTSQSKPQPAQQMDRSVLQTPIGGVQSLM